MVDTLGTQRRLSQGLVVGMGESYNVKSLCSVASMPISSIGDTVTFGRIPSNARLLAASRFYHTNLATVGAPSLSIGLFGVNANIDDDDDALTSGAILAQVGVDLLLFLNPALIGAEAWEWVSGPTSDPGGEFIVRGTIKDAVTDTAGTIALDMLYTVD